MRGLALFGVLISTLVFSQVPSNWESVFTRAQLALDQKRYDEAHGLLDEILKAIPNQTESLELKALTYKQSGDSVNAKKTYLQLFNRPTSESSAQQKGLYAFELGNLFWAEKDYKQARYFLRSAIQRGKNVEASHFLLGKIDQREQRWKESRENFERSAQNEIFKPSAKLLIAKAFKRENRMDDALGAFVEASETAELALKKESLISERARLLAQEVLRTSDRELRSFDRSIFLLEIGTSSGYDSNVLFMPNTADANNTSTAGSYKQGANWRLRYSSNPTERWQYVGAYQGLININFNNETKGGQFFVHDLNQYLTNGALKSTQYGMKIGGTGVLQYRTDAFRPFSLTGSAGPFLKTKISEDWWFGAETFFQASKNYLDPTISENAQRSGWEQTGRLYLSSAAPSPYWSPAIYLSGTIMRPKGNAFQGIRSNLDLTNLMMLSSKIFLAQMLGISAASYPDRTVGQRSDQGILVGLSTGYQATEELSLMAQADFSQNFSSDSSFRYNRWSGAISGTYRF